MSPSRHGSPEFPPQTQSQAGIEAETALRPESEKTSHRGSGKLRDRVALIHLKRGARIVNPIFLASDDASYITGQVLHPNGGRIVNDGAGLAQSPANFVKARE